MAIFEDITEKAMRAVSDASGLAVTIIGAGASGSIAGMVKSWFPEQTSTIGDETLATVVGFALFMWGDRVHPLLSSFGFGVLISSVGAWTSSFTSGLLAGLQKK
jgi:hypothetical protein